MEIDASENVLTDNVYRIATRAIISSSGAERVIIVTCLDVQDEVSGVDHIAKPFLVLKWVCKFLVCET